MMNKKSIGFLVDLFGFIVGSFIICVFIGVMLYIRPQVTDAFEESTDKNDEVGFNNQTIIVQATLNAGLESYSIFTWATVIVIGGMILSIIVSSFLVTQHPVIIVPYLFLFIIAVVLSSPISNSYEQIMNDEDMKPAFDSIASANYIMLNLPLWTTVLGFLGLIIISIRWVTRDQGAGYLG